MKRRNYWVLFAILLLALINLSPSKQSTLIRNEEGIIPEPVSLPNPKEVQEPGHFRVAVQMNEGEFLRLQQWNYEYMNQFADQVELVNLPSGESYRDLLQQFELGESPDVLLLDNVWIRKFASSGYLLPAERYYSSPLSGEVLSVTLGQNEWNGYLWGVPFDTDPYVFAYNPALIKELGLDHPPQSADDWEKLLSSFKKQSRIPSLLAVDISEPYAALSLLWQFGGNAAAGSPPFEMSEGCSEAFGTSKNFALICFVMIRKPNLRQTFGSAFMMARWRFALPVHRRSETGSIREWRHSYPIRGIRALRCGATGAAS